MLSGQYRSYSNVNFNTTHFLKTSALVENFDTFNSFDNNIKQFLNSDLNEHADVKDNLFFEEFESNLKFKGNRYEVKLPFTCSKEIIPDNYLLTKTRTEQLMKKLKNNDLLLRSYDNIIKDYLHEGIVEEANDIPEKGRVHYLPHRAVVRKERTTTKVRVVYDASSKLKNEPCLNDMLESGPCLLPLLFDILLRFRIGKIGLVSDIKKAFLQIEVAPEHRNYLRFLWYDDVYKPNPKLIILRFTRVVFGLTCSPFLLNGTLKSHLRKFLKDKSIIKYIERLLRDLYVDDSINSFDELSECVEFHKIAKSTLADGGFELHKWKTNDIELQKQLSPPDNTLLQDNSAEINFTKVLGLNWDTFNDKFVFEFQAIFYDAVQLAVTKRNVLKISSTIFDPLGFILPITLPLKLIFKKICLEKLNWDDELPTSLKRQWTHYLNELNSLQKVSVNRHVLCCCRDVELHGFCDSSGSAYCAVVYVKTVCSHGVTLKFWTGKCRVVPMKKLSIPRLELLACLLLAKLMVSVVEAVKGEVNVKDIFCWTDSQIAIWWIKQCEKNWNVWVQNRVEKIRSLLDKNWLFVSTDENPADIGTRPKPLNNIDFEMWWNGPRFLLGCREDWPSQEFILSQKEKVLEERVLRNTALNVVVGSVGIGSIIDCERYSSMDKLLRVTSYVVRFIFNLRKKIKKDDDFLHGDISTEENCYSNRLWIKYEQTFVIGSSKFEKLKNSLKLFYDEQNILRLNTRISNIENFNYDKKFPVLLRNDSYYTKLFILKTHEDHFHCGVNATLAFIRSNYWIIRGRQTIKKILKHCIICKIVQGKTIVPPETAKLPYFRLSCDHCFENVGIDYAGPLYNKRTVNGTTVMSKCYILLFTCAVTRAVHLELTPDVSAHSLLLALRRFNSRRGHAKLFISDNFKSFKSVDIKNYLRKHNFKWKFILEKSPWWGGFYERLVGLVKNLLKKSMGRTRLTYDEIFTLLLEVENIINCRPLTYISDNKDESFITPYHLMHGRSPKEKCLAWNDSDDIYGDNIRENYRKMQDVRQYFNKQFENNYIVALQEREYYNNNKINNDLKLIENDVVLIKEENIPRMLWRKGRVLKLIRGADERVRGAEIKVYQPTTGKSSILKRPLQHLVPFEISDMNRNNDSEVNETCKTDITTRPRRIAAMNSEIIRKLITAEDED